MADTTRTTFGTPTKTQIGAAQTELGRNAVAAMRRICETHLAGVTGDAVPTRGIYYGTDMHRLCREHDPEQFAALRDEGAFWSFRLPAEQWELSRASTEDELHNVWKVKEGVSASEALDAALEGPTIAGCKSTCHLAFASAVKEFIGDEKFDLLFKPGLPPRSGIGADGPFDELRAPRGGPCVEHMGDKRRKADRGRGAASDRGIGGNPGFNRGGPLALQSSYVSVPVWMKDEHTGKFEEGVWYGFQGAGNRIGGLSHLHFDGQSLNTICTSKRRPKFMGLNGQFVEGTQDQIFTLLFEAYRDHKDPTDMWSEAHTASEKADFRGRLTSPHFQSGERVVTGLELVMAVKKGLGASYREFLDNLRQYEGENPGVTEHVLESPFSVSPVQIRIDAELFSAVKRVPAESVVELVQSRLQST